jgi:hypothetical protein
MKLNAWLICLLTPLVAITALAQSPPPPPPAVPPPAVSAEPAPSVAPAAEPAAPKPAKKPKAKAKAKHAKDSGAKAAKTEKAPAKPSGVIVLNPPVSAAVKCEVLDVRGQGSFTGEVIGRVKKGDAVTVLEEITLAHPHSGEPAQWSKISMPTNIEVWVSGQFVDSNSTVRVKKVNLRGGPGENYSVVGSLEKGATVTENKRKAGWIKIAAPTNAFAFVASEYLEAGKPMEVAATPPPPSIPQPPPVAPVVVTVPPDATAPTPAGAPATGIAAPAPTATSQADQDTAQHQAPAPAVTAPAPTAPPAETEQSPRVVTREGFVHRSYNIQSPASYVLHDIKTGDTTEYLLPGKLQKFRTYVGTRVRITGPEYLDPRWPRTPILHVETVELMP